jgi:SAM-dependent methyltransferase
MKNSPEIAGKVLLPGTEKQTALLIRTVNESVNKILVIGAGTVIPSLLLRENYNAEVTIIVEDKDSLLTDRLRIKGEKNISVRMMDFTNTDFKKETFDLIYAQGSVSGKRRGKIIKELHRILVPNGFLCAGEITQTAPSPPQFVKNIWENSDIYPLDDSDIISFYTSRNFALIAEENLNSTLTEYYSLSYGMLESAKENLLSNEQSYYKKLLNRLSHESNAYLKLGADKYMGFRVLILRKAA